MVAAKKADFYAIAEKFHVDPVVARIIRNREVIGEKNIRIYLGGNLSDLSDPHQMKDMGRWRFLHKRSGNRRISGLSAIMMWMV